MRFVGSALVAITLSVSAGLVFGQLLDEAISREFSILNTVEEPIVFTEAISREFSVLNTIEAPIAITEGISREFSVLNTVEQPIVFAESISREFSVLLTARADFDLDGDVDTDDFNILAECALGPNVPQADAACQPCNLDGDDDVDAIDFAILQKCLTGQGRTSDPACEDW